ncbi:Druantia anti-phage system protein DruA [Thermodesulfobacteriota bacterium]
MDMLPITIRKRTITAADLESIQTTVNEHWDKGRTPISKILCQKWNWVQPNGQLKDMACRELLLTLNRKGLLKLPPRQTSAHNEKRNRSIPVVEVDQSPVNCKLADLLPVELKPVRNTEFEPLYNSLVQEHHYLGYRQIVGNHLKYMVFIGDRPVACIGWGSAAWSVKSRDAFVGWNKNIKENNLHFVANNTRFLILPWVVVKFLASKILALNAKRISDDWLKVYNHPLYLLETFVEKNRFKGTCYKAANWICTGQTKGIAKKGHDHLFHGKIKDVYLYPLRKNFRLKLTG